MNYYETLYIIHPALDAGRVKEMVLSVNETLEKTGGSVAAIDVWGKKKLAYEIDKQKYGTYVLVQFTGDGSGNANFNVELEHNPNVLAYLTIKIEEHKLIKNAINLDEQLSGANTGGDKQAKAESSEKASTPKEPEAVEGQDASVEESAEDKDASVEEVAEDKDASVEEAAEDKDASVEESAEDKDASVEESSDTDNDSDDSKEANANEAKDKE